MNESVIQDIAKKDFDCNLYAQRAINDEEFRSEIIDLLDHPKIMVYYNSFYILEKATAMKPELFYEYYHTFTSYLTHSNSYHRDFGLTLLANLVVVDTQKYFKDILIDYMALLRDPKFMTAECCARQLTKIMEVTKEYHALIIKLLFDDFLELPYTEKQRALLMLKP